MVKRGSRFAAALAVLLAGGLTPSPAQAVAGRSLDGVWAGTFAMGRSGQSGAVAGTFIQTGVAVRGTLALEGMTTQPAPVTGAVRRGKGRLAGASGADRVRWKGRWSAAQQVWRGSLVVVHGGRRVRGTATFGVSDGGPRVRCGAEYFASDVMPRVLEPICAQCHIAGGAAEATRLRVTVGSPVATAARAIDLVDFADPARSLLVLKPRGEVPHGGGIRFAAASPEDETLRHWIDLVTAPGCDGPGGGGGKTGNLYVDNCASCHGADARGLQGRPNIRCHRDITDAVRNGRTGASENMPAFPSFTDADIAAIQAYLLGLCPTGSAGDDLYAGNCATCHGADVGGTATAPGVRCATHVADAVTGGRGAAMPAFPQLVGADLTALVAYLDERCTLAGRTGADLFAGNCSTCHGATAGGGRNALGVRGPGIRCTEIGDYREKIWQGNDAMPAFPELDTRDVDAIFDFVHGSYCSAG